MPPRRSPRLLEKAARLASGSAPEPVPVSEPAPVRVRARARKPAPKPEVVPEAEPVAAPSVPEPVSSPEPTLPATHPDVLKPKMHARMVLEIKKYIEVYANYNNEHRLELFLKEYPELIHQMIDQMYDDYADKDDLASLVNAVNDAEKGLFYVFKKFEFDGFSRLSCQCSDWPRENDPVYEKLYKRFPGEGSSNCIWLRQFKDDDWDDCGCPDGNCYDHYDCFCWYCDGHW
jgi:hypothetical protein